jgi:hypothetical protein
MYANMLGAKSATKTIRHGMARGVIEPIDRRVKTPPKLESNARQKIAAKKRTSNFIQLPPMSQEQLLEQYLLFVVLAQSSLQPAVVPRPSELFQSQRQGRVQVQLQAKMDHQARLNRQQ